MAEAEHQAGRVRVLRLASVTAFTILCATLTRPALAQQCDEPVETKLIATPSDGGTVGLRVAIDGDYAVLGAQGNTSSGGAFVFFRDSGVWGQQARLTFPGQTGDQLGNQVAISGDTLFAAAQRGGSSDRGYVVPFDRHATSWVAQTPLTAPIVRNGQRFGSSVAADGQTVVVGAAFDDAVGSRSGSAHVFTRVGPDWVFQQSLFPDSGSSLFFGIEVAIDGDTILVGSSGDDDEAADAGAVYVFTRSGTTWSRQQKITIPGAGVSAGLARVAVDGDTAVLGASGFRTTTSLGAAFVYTRSGTVWSQQQVLTPSDGFTALHFANLVAIDGDRILVGVQDHSLLSQAHGAGYVFARQGGVWVQQLRIIASDQNAAASLGIGAALDGDTALLGAYQATHVPGGDLLGAAYAYDLPDASCPAVRALPKPRRGFLIAKKVSVKSRNSGDRVVVSGFMDVGPDGPDLGQSPEVEVGGEYFELPDDVQPDKKGRYRFKDKSQGIVITISPSKRGSSLAKVKMKLSNVPGAASQEQLRIRFGGGGIDAETTVVPNRGRYKSGRNALTGPPLAVTKLSGRVPDTGGQEFLLVVQTPTDVTGTVPVDPPVLFVQVGDVELDVPTEDMVRDDKKETWEYRAPAGGAGITFVRVDYRRGLVTIQGEDTTVGTFPAGPSPLTIFLGIDGAPSGVEVGVVLSGTSLRY